MATSEKEPADDKDDDADESVDEPKAAARAASKPAAASKGSAGSKAPTEEEEDEEDEDDEPPPPKVETPKKKTASGKAGGRPKEKSLRKDGPKAKLVTPRPAPPRAQGALGKSLVLFVIVVGGLALGFALLGREGGGGDATPAPKWNVGQTIDTEVTLVPSDSKDLACASADEISGRHCQYEAQAKPWSKGSDPDEKILKPYTTTDRIQFLAAGLWDQPALKGKLPNTRFSVKCKYKVEGKLKKPSIRWAADGQWFERADDWYAGSVNDCQLVGP